MAKSFLILFLTTTTPLLISFLGSINYYVDYFQEIFKAEPTHEVYDFIVVGGGSSGAVVALRLSQYYKVLLIEAGGDPIYLNSIPALAAELLGYPEFDWQYKTVPQKYVGFGIENNKITSNKGKVLGGSSVLNYMLYLRGNPMDYDNWAKISGDESWNYENILPFFKKSIKEYRGAFKKNRKHYEASPYGFLTIESLNFQPLLQDFKNAARDLGQPYDIDANGPQVPGFGNIEVTQNNGERMSTHAAILKDLVKNKNIRILKYAQATKVKLDKNGNAVGVWYRHHGGPIKLARVSKEIILSAGAYDSPKLLMLSGIGPKNELESISIKTKLDLPAVGKNLHDHANIFIFPVTVNASTFVMERDLGLDAIIQYLFKGKGVLTSATAVTGQGFWSSSVAQQEFSGKWPDIQFLFFPVGSAHDLKDSLIRVLGMKPDVAAAMMDAHDGKDGFILCPLLVRPKSRGAVRLQDKNPFTDPLIDPNFLSNKADLQTMIEALKFGLRMIEETAAFQKIGATLEQTIVPGCKIHKYRSDAYWECYIRHLLGTVWHPVGTCAMGKASDKRTVVDSTLRVIGVNGLRIIDASIMPVIVNANTNGPTIMIGEKGADMILDHWSQQQLVCSPLDLFKVQGQRPKCFYSTSTAC